MGRSVLGTDIQPVSCAYQCLRMLNYVSQPTVEVIQILLIISNVLAYNMNAGASYTLLGMFDSDLTNQAKLTGHRHDRAHVSSPWTSRRDDRLLTGRSVREKTRMVGNGLPKQPFLTRLRPALHHDGQPTRDPFRPKVHARPPYILRDPLSHRITIIRTAAITHAAGNIASPFP